MRDLDKMLEGLAEEKNNLERGENNLTELEERRIYTRTMQKIQEEREREMNNQRENRGKEHFWRKYSRLVTAAAVAGAVCLAGATAVAAFGLDQNIKNFFHIQDEAEEKKAEKLVSEVDTKAESNGVKISVSQIISDKSRFYAVLDAKDIPDEPNELEFEETDLTVQGKDGKKYDYTMQEPKMGGIDGNNTKFAFLVSGINDNGEDVDINGKKVNITLKNIGYHENDGTFVSVVKGNWKLDWTIQNEADSETVPVDKKIQLLDSKGIWRDIVISPLSLTVHFNITEQGKTHLSEEEWEKYEESDRLTVQFTDGTRIDSRFAEDVNESWGTKEELGYKNIGFSRIIDSKQIESVTFGKKTIVLNKSSNTVSRTNVTAKAANCTIALPEEVSKILSLEEKMHEKNADFGCKEMYTIFWGEKNNARMPLFTIHRLKGMFSEEDLDEKNPMMTYIGYHQGYTYTIEYGEIQDENQNREFADILNKYISNVLPYFEYQS